MNKSHTGRLLSRLSNAKSTGQSLREVLMLRKGGDCLGWNFPLLLWPLPRIRLAVSSEDQGVEY